MHNVLYLIMVQRPHYIMRCQEDKIMKYFVENWKPGGKFTHHVKPEGYFRACYAIRYALRMKEMYPHMEWAIFASEKEDPFDRDRVYIKVQGLYWEDKKC